MQQFEIREAQPEDARGIASVHVETWQCAYRGQIIELMSIIGEYIESIDTRKRTSYKSSRSWSVG